MDPWYHLLHYQNVDPAENATGLSWGKLAGYLQEVSYSCYNVDPISAILNCGNPRKHVEGLFASSSCKRGDVVVVYFRETSRHFILWESKEIPRSYTFLGPCILKGEDDKFYREYRHHDAHPPRSMFEKLSRDPSSRTARVGRSVHLDCWKHVNVLEIEEFDIV